MQFLKAKNTKKNYFDFNKWNNKWDKINMAKDEVIKEYNNTFGKGLKFNKKNIKDFLFSYIYLNIGLKLPCSLV